MKLEETIENIQAQRIDKSLEEFCKIKLEPEKVFTQHEIFFKEKSRIKWFHECNISIIFSTLQHKIKQGKTHKMRFYNTMVDNGRE